MKLLDRKDWIALALIAALAGFWQLRGREAALVTESLQPAEAPASARMNDAYGKLPLSFEVNRGQAGGAVRFLSRGAGYGLFLKANEAELRLRGGDSFASVTMKLLGANPSPKIEGIKEQPSKSNYLAGNDPAKWRTDVANFAKVRYREVYREIDLIFYGNQRQLEYDFVVAPGADPRAIRLRFAGAKRLRVDEQGDLLLATAAGVVRQRKPIVYQETNGERREVEGRYVIDRRNQVRLALGAYDASQPLIIDPVIAYSTLLGGGREERAKGIAVDAAGNVYVAGYTASSDFNITPGAFRANKSSTADIFVSKLDAAGRLVYSTYLGGHQEFCCIVLNTDGGLAIDAAVDAAGAVYVAGHTTLRDYPTTPNAFQPALSGNCASGGSGTPCYDAFVTKLNASGNALVYSTFLGGNEFDAASGIAVDAAGNAYVTGKTNSPNFPTTPGAFQTGAGNVFVTKLNPAGTALVYSTRLGNGVGELAYAIAADAAGNAYVTGTVAGPFPTTPGAFQRTTTIGPDAFVTKLNPAGTALVYSTYLGGASLDLAFDLALDAMGSAYVVGYTFSRNFPVTPNAFQPAHGGGDQDVFVTKLNPVGAALVYSTYLGGNNLDLGYGIAVDAAGRAAVTGETFSTNFPLTTDALPLSGGIFVARFDPTGTGLDFSTRFGGSGRGYGAATDARGDLYITGETYLSSSDILITKLSGFTAPAPTVVANVSAASFAPAVARGSIVAAFGPGLANIIREAGAMPLPTALGGVAIKVRDSASVERLASIFFVSPNQINYLMPEGTSDGTARIAIERGGVELASEQKAVVAVAPGLFAANANGQGVPAAVALRLTAFGVLTYEPVARFDAQQRRFVAVPIDLGREGDQVFLLLFGTGLRNRASLAAVSSTIGGTTAEVLYAGPQPTFTGLDQVNLRLPRILTGRGEVDVVVTAENKEANIVKIDVK